VACSRSAPSSKATIAFGEEFLSDTTATGQRPHLPHRGELKQSGAQCLVHQPYLALSSSPLASGRPAGGDRSGNRSGAAGDSRRPASCRTPPERPASPARRPRPAWISRPWRARLRPLKPGKLLGVQWRDRGGGRRRRGRGGGSAAAELAESPPHPPTSRASRTGTTRRPTERLVLAGMEMPPPAPQRERGSRATRVDR
jgi:hypothetical protein